MRNVKKLVSFWLVAGILSGCAPLLVGAGGAVIADKVVENKQGDDGLF
jgi:hypothetical protein